MNEQYINLRYSVLGNCRMNLREKVIYSYIDGFFDGEFHASNKYIGKMFCCSERSAQKAITNLKKYGLIKTEKVFEDGICVGRIIRIKKKL